jgi:hypothetical protein
MAASQIELAARGQEDRWLTESPSRTFFEAKYKPRINRLRETLEIPFDYQGVTFGTTGQSTIPVKGDYLTGLTLRAVLPPIYPTVPGQYVFPTPSSQVGGSVYVNMGLTQIVANGTTLTANTTGNHYFSVGAPVILSGTAYSIFDLDGTYTINGIPTANSFTCSTVLSGISYNGTVSSPGISCGDVVSYFSTQNSNLWVNNLTNKTWQITGGTVVGTTVTFTTSAPSNFPVGSQVVINLPGSGIVNQTVTVSASTDTTFTYTINLLTLIGSGIVRSNDNGKTWSQVTSSGGRSTGFGNGTFIVDNTYSIDNGSTWNPSYNGAFFYPSHNLAFGNGTFIGGSNIYDNYGYSEIYRSTDNGETWTSVPPIGYWSGKTFGNGTFVIVGYDQIAYSTTDGLTWNSISFPGSFWNGVTFGNGTFVAVGNNQIAYSTNGYTWTVNNYFSNDFKDVAFGNGTFVTFATNNSIARSTTNGHTWTITPDYNFFYTITFGNGIFILGGYNITAYSNDNGQTWTPNPFNGILECMSFGFGYSQTPSDSVSLVIPPLQLTNRDFISTVYPSISFANAEDAAFWGFDARNGLTYSFDNGNITPPWSLVQSGWIAGFLPPSASTWDDSVAHKLCKAIRIMVGKQTIKEYSGEYIELLNDLTVDYANKAILKLMNGTLDQTQAIVSREYYVSLPLGTREIPLCALTHQNMSVEIDFERYANLSRNLNPGTGIFTDPKSYVTYDASTGLLNGSPLNVQATFSYQQYIFIVTYDGLFIIYDTTLPVSDSTSYTVLSAFSGTSVFQQFCVLSGILYIGLSDGTLARVNLNEIIQGNISSFTLNNYTPTIGSLTGTIVADFRYVYYAVSNTVTSNVFVSQYDTKSSFTYAASYKSVDFTLNFNSNVEGVYQFISTGTELVMLPQGTPGSLYTFQLNANVQSQWYLLDYSAYGTQITEGVLVGSSLYFVIDNFNILKYTNSIFTFFNLLSTFVVVSDYAIFSIDRGKHWNFVDIAGSLFGICFGNELFVAVGGYSSGYQRWISSDYGRTWLPSGPYAACSAVAFGNNTFVAVGYGGTVSYSSDNGQTWTSITPNGYDHNAITFGNGTFVAVGQSTMYSTDNGQTWTISLYDYFDGIAFGNDTFVAVTTDQVVYSTNNGQTWTTVPLSGYWREVAFGNGTFVIVGYFDETAYSTDNGQTWTTVPLVGNWVDIAFEDGTFVAVGYFSGLLTSYSNDNGHTWTSVSISGVSYGSGSISASPSTISVPGDGFKNLLAVGNYIYASTNNVAIQIDTTKDLSTAAAYTFPAPVPTGQYVFANGPRYVYLFSQGDPTAQNVYRFDPYPPNTTLQASIIVDYESLPEGVKKPDKALIGLVQTQKVTNMDVMDLHGPVKELWITGVADTANVFQYANLSNQVTLTFTAGEEMITPDTGTRKMLSVIQPFEMHTSMPVRNVSTFSFEMDPESSTPNGTVNFSRIYEQALTANAATVWARNYNILAIQGGIGGLMFN